MKKTFNHSFAPVIVGLLGVVGSLAMAALLADRSSSQIEVIFVEPANLYASAEENLGQREDIRFKFSKWSLSEAALLQRAAKAVELKDYKTALRDYRAWMQKNKKSQRDSYPEALLSYLDGQWEVSEKILKRMDAEQGDRFQVLYLRARTLDKGGRRAEAIKFYERSLKKRPNYLLTYLRLSSALLKVNRAPQAVEVLMSATQLGGNKEKAETFYLLGKAHKKTGHAEDALAAWEKSIRFKPDNLEARIQKTLLAYRVTGDKSAALEAFDKIFRLDNKNPRAYYALGQLQSRSEALPEAEAAYKKAIFYSPEDWQARFNLGLLYLRQKRYQDAENQIAWITKNHPENAKAFFSLASAQMSKKPSSAIKNLKIAIQLRDGDYKKASLSLGKALTRVGELEAAEQIYRNLLQRHPDYAKAWYNLGRLQTRRGRYETARRSMQQASRLNPGHKESWFNLGVLLTRLKKDLDAVEAYRQALKLDPAYTKARLNLASRLADLDKSRQAIKLYKAMIGEDPQYSRARQNLGLLYLKEKFFLKALDQFQEVLKLDPQYKDTDYFLSKTLIGLQRPSEAVEILKGSLEKEPSRMLLRELLLNALVASGDIEMAKKELKKAFKLDPGNIKLKKIKKELGL